MAADGQESHGPVSGGHPDLDTLADADAAALDPPVTAEVLGHAAACAVCSALLDALRAVRSDLASLPRPPVPAAVVARLDAVLDVERRSRPSLPGVPGWDGQASPAGVASAARGPEPRTVGDVVAFGPARTRRRRRWLGWAVAAAVVVGAGGVAATVALDGGHGGGVGAGADDTTIAAGTLARPSPTTSGPGHAVVPLSPGNGLVPQETAGSVPSYTRQDIEDHIAAILAAAGCGGGPCQGDLLSDGERRSRCTSELNGQGVPGSPKAVQFAFFEGTPAFVFVFDGDRVVVVGTDCGDSASPTILFSDR